MRRQISNGSGQSTGVQPDDPRNVGVFGTTFQTLTTARAGTMTLTLSWSGGVDLDLYLVNTTCGNDGTIDGCQFFGTANGFDNPEVITPTVTANESFKIVMDNNSQSGGANYSLAVNIQ